MGELNHFDNAGNAVMADISGKRQTERTAVAKGRLSVNRAVFEAIDQKNVKKGDVLGIARIAGIMAAKKTGELIPLCHMLSLTTCKIEFNMFGDSLEIETICEAKSTGQTGVEMEALTGVSVALLTIYDMCKALDRSMTVKDIYLVEKKGGKSGDYARREQADGR